jgi:hypothetical protein
LSAPDWVFGFGSPGRQNRVPVRVREHIFVNREAARFYGELGAARLVFPRYLTLAKISDIVAALATQTHQA